MMAAMDQKLDLSLPSVPPPPTGERIEVRARGLAGLIAGQESAVVYHDSEPLTAMVIVINGRVVDAVAETKGKEVVKGVDVLDELGEVPVADLQVIGVTPRLARALPVYWRAPGATKELVATLIQPGRRGALLASSPTRGTGVVVFDEHGIVASFVNGEVREEAIDELLDDPATVIAPRVEPRPGGAQVNLHPAQTGEAPAAEAPVAQQVAGGPAPAGVIPGPPPGAFDPPPTAFDSSPPGGDRYGAYGTPGFPAAPDQPGYPAAGPGSQFGPPGESFGGWGPGNFSRAGSTPPPAGPYGGPAAEAELEHRRVAIVELLQRELGRHAESVSAPFRTAPTLDALEGAAQGLARESVRLVSSNRMQNLSLQATAIARGEQPPQ